MNIETIKIDKINPATYNPRVDLKPGDPDYEKLKKSISEFDIVEPLIWNKRTGNLVGGHQRLKILKELGHTEVEVSVVDLDDVKEKALNLALNKISGDWDYPKLKDLLQELDTGEFDMEITGFDEKEIEQLMTQYHSPEEEWRGMPEFKQEDKLGFRDLVVHFKNQKAVDDFFKLVNQPFTEKTKYIWFPETEKDNRKNYRFENEP